MACQTMGHRQDHITQGHAWSDFSSSQVLVDVTEQLHLPSKSALPW